MDISMTRHETIMMLDNLETPAVAFIDSMSVVPFGSICKAIKDSIKSYRDQKLVNNLFHFLHPIYSIDGAVDLFDEFWHDLDEVEQEYLSNYLIGLVDSAETTEKALIMGYLFKACIRKEISEEELLRLCIIVRNIYTQDLQDLPNHVEKNQENFDDTATESLINAGLIDNDRIGIWASGPEYLLNDLGIKLHSILLHENWLRNSK